MKVYKIVFARNEIVLCKETSATVPEEIEIRYEQSKGQLIYAFVTADDMNTAIQQANELVPRLAIQLASPATSDPSSQAI